MTILYYTLFEEKISDDLFKEKLSILPPIFREKILKFWRWEDAYASMFGKFLLLEGLHKFGIAADLSDLKFTKYGKPYLLDSTVSFNISHSANCVVCVVSDEVETVGVDVEQIKPLNFRSFENYYADQEWREIISGSPYVFYKYWTRKEAVLKADGRGLGIPLKEINVFDRSVQLENKVYYLNNFNLHPKYVLHVASTKDSMEINPIRFQLDSFKSKVLISN